ncbi:MAG: hypothetical protein ACHQDE_00705 [Acidimicrobiia bacterium]
MSTDVAVADAGHLSPTFEASLAAEEAAERDLLRSLVKAVLIALPISIAFFLVLVGVAIGDKTHWYVWVGLGIGLGTIGALLLGALAGATLNAHKLDQVDRATYND